MMDVENHNVEDVNEYRFITYHYFLVVSFTISKNVDVCVTNIQLVGPFDHILVDEWLVSIDVEQIYSNLAFVLVC